MVISFSTALLGYIPNYSSAKDVLRVAQQLNQIGAVDKSWELFKKHPGVEVGNAALCLLLADCHRQRGDGRAELAALKAAS